jgi:hypothetical protein
MKPRRLSEVVLVESVESEKLLRLKNSYCLVVSSPRTVQFHLHFSYFN